MSVTASLSQLLPVTEQGTSHRTAYKMKLESRVERERDDWIQEFTIFGQWFLPSSELVNFWSPLECICLHYAGV